MESFHEKLINQLDHLSVLRPLKIFNSYKKRLWKKKETITNLRANIDIYMEKGIREGYFKKMEKKI
jgi:hypothetical protein